MTSRTEYASPMSDIESRMGLIPLEELLRERDELIAQVAPLRAKHGPGGVWDDQRRVLRSTLAMKVRIEAEAQGQKRTEAFIEDAAHSLSEYTDFIAQGAQEKADWFIAENRVQSITDTINRGQVVARFVTQELTLADG